MVIGVLQVELGIPGAFSLKDKRSVLKGLVARLQRKHLVSVAEVGDQDVWNRARLGIAFVSNDGRHAQSHLQKVVNALEREREAVLEDSLIELL